MSCDELQRLIAAEDDAAVSEHLKSCTICALPEEQITKLQRTAVAGWKPVRRNLPGWVQVLLLCTVCVGVSVGAGFYFGDLGLHALSPSERWLYLGYLTAGLFVACFVVVQRMRPGSRLQSGSGLWLDGAILAAVVLALFPDVIGHDFAFGRHCFETGCLVSGIAAIVFSLLLLRRGFASNPVTAFASAGFLAGLCGASALALHCPVLQMPHIMVWHLTVLPVATVAGAAFGFLTERFSFGRP